MKNITIPTICLIIVISSLSYSCKHKDHNHDTSLTEKTKTSVPQLKPYETITLEEARAIFLAHGNEIFIDVRTPKETAKGMIPGAININVKGRDFKEKVRQLDRDQAYVVYCKSGSRSSRASKVMQDLGFTNFKNVEVGYIAWAKKYGKE